MKKKIVAATGWTRYYQMINDAVDRNWSKGPGEVDAAVKKLKKQFGGNPAFDEAYRRWKDTQEEDIEEDDSQFEPLYVIKDKHGNQLSSPSKDDSVLWDRVAEMEARGKRGLSVVVYTPAIKSAIKSAEDVSQPEFYLVGVFDAEENLIGYLFKYIESRGVNAIKCSMDTSRAKHYPVLTSVKRACNYYKWFNEILVYDETHQFPVAKYMNFRDDADPSSVDRPDCKYFSSRGCTIKPVSSVDAIESAENIEDDVQNLKNEIDSIIYQMYQEYEDFDDMSFRDVWMCVQQHIDMLVDEEGFVFDEDPAPDIVRGYVKELWERY